MLETTAQHQKTNGTDKEHDQQCDQSGQRQIELFLDVRRVGRDDVLDGEARIVVLGRDYPCKIKLI